MYLPTTREGFEGAAGWYCGTVILANFDAQYEAGMARLAADPGRKPNPFADKPSAKPVGCSLEDYCARIRAGGGSREGMRAC